MGECKERHCGNGWRCFDFEIPYTLETADQKAHRNSRHFNAWMSNDQACPPVRRISGADIFHISLGEQPLTTRVHPRRGYFRENTITSGTGSARKIYPRIMGEGRPPVSAVSIARLIQNGRQLNSMIKSLTVTSIISWKDSNGWIFLIDQILYLIYIRRVRCIPLLPLTDPETIRLSEIIIIILHSIFISI